MILFGWSILNESNFSRNAEKQRLSAKRQGFLCVFLCVLNLINDTLWRAEQHFKLFCFLFFCSWGQFLLPQAALAPTRRRVFPLFATGSAALRLQRLSPVQRTELHSQVHAKAPCCAKWCEPPPSLAPFVSVSWAEALGVYLEERSNPPVLTVPSPHFTSCFERNEGTASYVKAFRPSLDSCPAD